MVCENVVWNRIPISKLQIQILLNDHLLELFLGWIFVDALDSVVGVHVVDLINRISRNVVHIHGLRNMLLSWLYHLNLWVLFLLPNHLGKRYLLL